ncbi:chain length determinant-like protein [Psychromonas sp. psych-6C06]|uniref:Wzz/FepE/Etk N-terminal domain-containing protein n=1 Tax=Psychromonas sp. psych-6C06 TaxID=2058089 RepID=UPI000C32E274|nr:Wzz/FepE/Etk N-terminal domain-containing protein [Psychromonas sp. psych-6C06]PKF61917.1 chain length determinant-like protein [Psychromonas sp. psych-6C06]
MKDDKQLNTATPYTNNVGVYQHPYKDDEIDLRELIKVIWDYKWFTALMCTIAIIGSVLYALNAQEWWVSKAKVVEPQLNDVVTLYSQSKQVGAILNASNSGTNRNEIKEFLGLFEPETLFSIFTDSFNSSLNKKLFLVKNETFNEYLASKNVAIPTDELTAENQLIREAYRKVLNEWMASISASLDAKSGELTLSFRSNTKSSSAKLLNDYIDFVSKDVKENQFDKFLIFVDSSKKDLSVSIDITKKRVEQSLALMLKKTEYAYQIASQAELVDYQTNLNPNKELFEINLGEKALKAKVAVLKSITDLSLIDSSISEKQITLDSLNQLQFSDERSFSPFRYLEIVEPPLARAAPKRALIVILATLLAGMLSIFIALVHYFLTKKEND